MDPQRRSRPKRAPRQLHPIQAAAPPRRTVHLLKVAVQATLAIVTLNPDGSVRDVQEQPNEPVFMTAATFDGFPAELRRQLGHLQAQLDAQAQPAADASAPGATGGG